MNAIPKMTFAEKTERSAAKKKIILDFLASGEVYTTAAIAADLLQCSRTRVLACLDGLVKDGSINAEQHSVDAHKLMIYGITPHGLAQADRFENPHFELGRTNSAYIQHRITTQRMRLKAEKAGGFGWVPERAVRLKYPNLQKVPDAFFVTRKKEIVAFECERHCKTPKRYAEIINAYISEIKLEKYHFVYFVCPPGVEVLVERAMRRVKYIKVGGSPILMTEEYFSRFKFFNFNNFME